MPVRTRNAKKKEPTKTVNDKFNWNTVDEESLLRMRAALVPYKAIGDKLGRSPLACRLHMHRLASTGRVSAATYDLAFDSESRMLLPHPIPKISHPEVHPRHCPQTLICCCRRHAFSVPPPPCHKQSLPMPSELIEQQGGTATTPNAWRSIYGDTRVDETSIPEDSHIREVSVGAFRHVREGVAGVSHDFHYAISPLDLDETDSEATEMEVDSREPETEQSDLEEELIVVRGCPLSAILNPAEE